MRCDRLADVVLLEPAGQRRGVDAHRRERAARPAAACRPRCAARPRRASIRAAGQIATTAATRSLAAPAWIAISPPMLEPRTRDPALVHLGPCREPSASEAQVVDHARAEVAVGLAVAAVVEGQRDEAVAGRRRARSRRGSPCASPRRAGPSPPGPGPLAIRAATGTRRCRRACPAPSEAGCAARAVHNARQYGGYRPQPRLPARLARERARPPRGGGLRRGRAGGALRHARLHLRRGRHARAGPRLHRGVRGPGPTTSR